MNLPSIKIDGLPWWVKVSGLQPNIDINLLLGLIRTDADILWDEINFSLYGFFVGFSENWNKAHEQYNEDVSIFLLSDALIRFVTTGMENICQKVLWLLWNCESVILFFLFSFPKRGIILIVKWILECPNNSNFPFDTWILVRQVVSWRPQNISVSRTVSVNL